MRNVCMWFDSFVNDAVLWKSKKYKDMLQKYELEKDQLSGLEEANYVSKKPPTIQTLVAYQTIKEVNNAFLNVSIHTNLNISGCQN